MNRKMDRQTHRLTDGQTNRQTDILTDKHMNKQTFGQAYRHTD